MTEIEHKCPQGRDSGDLLSYVEGELDDATREEIERHVQSCRACASMVEFLREAHQLLRDHPEAFHPDAVDLCRYAGSQIDPDSPISAHVDSCAQCRRDVQMLQEMMAISRESPGQTREIPKKLLLSLEREWAGEPSPHWTRSLSAFLSDLIRPLFRAPTLALGTVTAVVVMALLAIPLWQAFVQKVPQPETTVAVPEPSSETGKGRVAAQRRKRDVVRSEAQRGVPVSKLKKNMAEPQDAEQERQSAPSFSFKPATPPPVRSQADALKEETSRQPGVSVGSVAPAEQRRSPSKAEAPRRESADKKSRVGVVRESGKVSRTKEKSPQDLQDLLRPVNIRIVDEKGKPIPWLRPEVPKQFKGKFRLVEPRPEKEALPSLQQPASRSIADAARFRSPAALSVVVHIAKRGVLYDLSATLSGPQAEKIQGRVDALGIPRQDLERRVRSLVAFLLSVSAR